MVAAVPHADAGNAKPNKNARMAAVQKSKPAVSRSQMVAQLPKTPRKTTNSKFQLANDKLPGQRGVVLDAVTINVNKTNWVFKGDTTYYVSAAVILSGSGSGSTNTTTFEAGTVLKYSPTNTAKLTIQNNNHTWQGPSYQPVVFTAPDATTRGDPTNSN